MTALDRCRWFRERILATAALEIRRTGVVAPLTVDAIAHWDRRIAVEELLTLSRPTS